MRQEEPSWFGWGDPAQVPVLSEEVMTLLREGLGVRAAGRRVGAFEDVELPGARLDGDALEVLRDAVGAEHVLCDDAARIRHLRGKSTPDLLRIRARDVAGAPDAVLMPQSHAQVMDVLRACSERRIAAVPFGGGTSVTGALEPDTSGYNGQVALDLRRMNDLVSLDAVSRVAELGPGLRGPQAEALLGDRGFTLGHFPQSFEYATL